MVGGYHDGSHAGAILEVKDSELLEKQKLESKYFFREVLTNQMLKGFHFSYIYVYGLTPKVVTECVTLGD